MVLVRKIETPYNGLLHTVANVKLEVNGLNLGSGTLFVCKDYFSWRPTNQLKGVFVPWKQISSLCLRHMCETSTRFVFVKLADGDKGEPRTELSLIPSEIDAFIPIYDAMRECCPDERPTGARSSWSTQLSRISASCFFICCLIPFLFLWRK